MREFVHLHTWSEYSILEAISRPRDLAAKAREDGMPALALTDLGVMFGAVDHFNHCQMHGIKPILGCEVTVTGSDGQNGLQGGASNPRFRLVLLCQNNEGWKNLSQLVSRSWTEGLQGGPSVDMKLLRSHSDGLICLTGGLDGPVTQCLTRGDLDGAMKMAGQLRQVFGPERTFVELQNHGRDEELSVLAGLNEVAASLGLGVVATNHSRYTRSEDWGAHDVWARIKADHDGVPVEPRALLPKGQYFLKSPAEMALAFKGYEAALENTLKVAEMVDLGLPCDLRMPSCDVPRGFTLETHFDQMVRAGFEARLSELRTMGQRRGIDFDAEVYAQRLEHEIGVITEMGFEGYFMVWWDLMQFARNEGLAVGPGRGRVPGSLVAYCLGITDVDPIRHGLLFEMFLNSERVAMPDVAVDFCRDRRDEVMRYLPEKYGRDRVARTVTFGAMTGKMMLKDVARVLEVDHDALTSAVDSFPDGMHMSIEKALETSPCFRAWVESSEANRQWIDVARKLDGVKRHVSAHAAQMIVAPCPVTNRAPVWVEPSSGELCVQCDGDAAAQLGFVRFELLGLDALTVIQKIRERVHEETGVTVESGVVRACDDEATLALFQRGDTHGIFQFDSDGMGDLLVRANPQSFDDLVAVFSLCRPAPMKNGMVDAFIRQTHGAPGPFELEDVAPILAETRGLILYREQIMRLAHVIGGFGLDEADLIWRALARGNPDAIDRYRQQFLDHASSQGRDLDACGQCFDQMAEAAPQSMAKSHAVAYTTIAWEMAYLKAQWPEVFVRVWDQVRGYEEGSGRHACGSSDLEINP